MTFERRSREETPMPEPYQETTVEVTLRYTVRHALEADRAAVLDAVARRVSDETQELGGYAGREHFTADRTDDPPQVREVTG